ncbi:hypothetical protein CTI14_63385, partial [Methylobacterium radiotolerans]
AAQKLKPETIRSVQRAIKDADYYTGALDGRFNPVFVRALDQYARANETESAPPRSPATDTRRPEAEARDDPLGAARDQGRGLLHRRPRRSLQP